MPLSNKEVIICTKICALKCDKSDKINCGRQDPFLQIEEDSSVIRYFLVYLERKNREPYRSTSRSSSVTLGSTHSLTSIIQASRETFLREGDTFEYSSRYFVAKN